MTRPHGAIRVGIGGWVFEPWRGTFYPEGLPQKRELQHAASHLGTIEINGTYYGSQKPESFARWRAETPDGFVFAVKGSRYITNRRVLAEAAPSIEKFFSGGVTELKEKLGPINWQFMPTKAFDPADFEAFLKLLPHRVGGIDIRHAVEVRHHSFRTPDFVALLRAYGVAAITAADSDYPQIADVTAPFVYARIMGTSETEPEGYPGVALDRWVARARQWAKGEVPDDLEPLSGEPAPAVARDVFLYVISGAKIRNPAAAMALTRRLANEG
ncbi:MAG: DUF72 domain-containing protein [Bosea sp. (in: a-proteobacteria)]|uniref:DUF72 domain-containing protein n=1 Tax=Bosea sp. (in: a-proteobacteria) TaxID=1871050 RepID=UPI00273271C2|nr:DUF72 domain-containing protein [Bosea sp. (in: a-proteobacteria)]MDP3255399.1 DUF72 domain-containing protein [Bosea sp. (in: a-proteobacteria)]MDP3318445.1 DUF72 domain-containing protein [Bosea sp. (in: a-proteobacteria)]